MGGGAGWRGKGGGEEDSKAILAIPGSLYVKLLFRVLGQEMKMYTLAFCLPRRECV